MSDRYQGHQHSLTSPVRTAVDIVPDNNNDLLDVTRAIRCNTPGNIVVIFIDDTLPVTLSILDSIDYAYRIKRVLATGTTVTGLVGLL